jgi:hypothetical protein
MKPLMLAGAFLTAAGIVALLFHNGIHYTSTQKFPRDGQTQIVIRQAKVQRISPVFGGLTMAAGVSLMILAARR